MLSVFRADAFCRFSFSPAPLFLPFPSPLSFVCSYNLLRNGFSVRGISFSSSAFLFCYGTFLLHWICTPCFPKHIFCFSFSTPKPLRIFSFCPKNSSQKTSTQPRFQGAQHILYRLRCILALRGNFWLTGHAVFAAAILYAAVKFDAGMQYFCRALLSPKPPLPES